MAQLCVCDLCREIVPHGDIKYIFAWKKVTENGDGQLSEEYIEFVKNMKDSDVIIKEICSGCFKVFVYFLNLRKKQLTELSKEVEDLYKIKGDKKNEK